MSNFMLIGIFVGLGLFFRRLEAFPKDSAQVLNMFALYVSLPALILLKMPLLELGSEALVVAVAPWGMLLLSVALILPASRKNVPIGPANAAPRTTKIRTSVAET